MLSSTVETKRLFCCLLGNHCAVSHMFWRVLILDILGFSNIHFLPAADYPDQAFVCRSKPHLNPLIGFISSDWSSWKSRHRSKDSDTIFKFATLLLSFYKWKLPPEYSSYCSGSRQMLDEHQYPPSAWLDLQFLLLKLTFSLAGFMLFIRGFVNYSRVRKLVDPAYGTLPRTRVLFIY